jgi:hypothetical protein
MTLSEAASSIRANVEILPGAGMAEGRQGFVRGINLAYGTVKVGLTDGHGDYTGEAVPVNPKFVSFTGGVHLNR